MPAHKAFMPRPYTVRIWIHDVIIIIIIIDAINARICMI